MLAPAGTPPEVIGKLNGAVNAFLQTAQAKETFGSLGIEPAGGSPEELKVFIAAEVAKWAPIVKAANIEF
jgi:tripartite-type tricarboxylate transporter receptor subunit TctC